MNTHEPIPVPVTVTSSAVRTASAARIYLTEHLMNLTPVEVVQKLYDLAILGCKKRDTALAQKALTELISALNFDEKEIALRLFHLYDYCKESLRKGNPERALDVLEKLRTAWNQAFHLA